jgi:hypothetical protein
MNTTIKKLTVFYTLNLKQMGLKIFEFFVWKDKPDDNSKREPVVVDKLQVARENVQQRINELKNIDADICKIRWNMELPQHVRNHAREQSNEITYARQELERILDLLK